MTINGCDRRARHRRAALARRLSAGLPGLALRRSRRAIRPRRARGSPREKIACPVVELDALPQHCDLAVECAPGEIIEQICRPMLTAGKRVMVLSAGALLPRPDLIELAKKHGGQIIVPTGALLGLDAVTAAAEGTITFGTMVTRKPPNGLAGANYLVANDISVDGLNEPLRVFAGSAREAAAGFPENVNVVAALALAGIGPDRTMIEIWADPGADAQLPHHQCGGGFGALFVLDRERAVGKSEDRPDHGAVGDRGAAQARRAAAGGDVNQLNPSRARRRCRLRC